MHEHVYPLERRAEGSTMELGRPTYPPAIRAFASGVHAAAGATEDHPLSMFDRLAHLARIYDDPNEVHKTVVARRILAKYEKARQ